MYHDRRNALSTGFLMRISTAESQEAGLKYLVPLTTYVLVEKRVITAQTAHTRHKARNVWINFFH